MTKSSSETCTTTRGPLRWREMEMNYGFKNGWPQFYEENCLEPTDFVMFQYVCGNLFDVRLIGRDACEKKGLGGPRVVMKEEFCAEDDSDEEWKEDEEEMEMKRSCKKKAAVDWYGEEIFKSGAAIQPKKKKAAVDWYGEEIFKSGAAIQPKNPYFVSRRRKRDNELIPKDVIAEQKLEIPAKLVMVDGRGRKWEDKVKNWKDGRVWCSRGWKSLCRANNTGADDACICEFLQQPPHCTILHMRLQPLPAPASASSFSIYSV